MVNVVWSCYHHVFVKSMVREGRGGVAAVTLRYSHQTALQNARILAVT